MQEAKFWRKTEKDIEDQIEWEHAYWGVAEDRRQEQLDTRAKDTKEASWFVSGAVAELVEAFHEARKEGFWVPLEALSAEALATIVMATLIDCGAYADRPDGVPLPTFSRNLHAALVAERQYLAWRGEADKPTLAAIRQRYPDLKRATWTRIAKTLRELPEDPWPDEASQNAVASRMADIVVAAVPTWVELTTLKRARGIGAANCLRLTDTAQQILKDAGEVRRPFVMPMICPPDSWRIENDQRPVSPASRADNVGQSMGRGRCSGNEHIRPRPEGVEHYRINSMENQRIDPEHHARLSRYGDIARGASLRGDTLTPPNA